MNHLQCNRYPRISPFSNAMFRCQNIISLVPRDRSLFIAWGGGGDYGGESLDFKDNKRGDQS